MKILCVSDQIDPLIYTSSIKQRYADVDLILSAGDLPLDYLDFIVSTLNKPMYFVFGNHHTSEMIYYQEERFPYNTEAGKADHYSASSHIDAKLIHEDGILIAGLGGSMKYNNGENQFTDLHMYLRIIKLLPAMLFNRIFRGRFLDILLTHASPLGIHDKEDKCHRGFKSFLWFMRAFRPKYLIHGHIHLYDLSEVRTTKFRDTLVINAYSHYLIDTGEKK